MTSTELPNPLGGERLHYDWRGHDIAYVKRGQGAPVVLVHSVHACAWSMEWRTVVPQLSERFTTYSIDMLGFGASAHPELFYTAEIYLELLHDFLVEVVARPAALVGSSLGGAYAVATAARHPALATAVCAIGPAGVTRLDTPSGAGGAFAQGLLRSPLLGSALFGALTSKAGMRTFLKKIYVNRDTLTDEVLELYARGAQQPGARFAPAAFVGMRLNIDIKADLANMPCRFMLVWGKDAAQTPLSEGAIVHALRPGSPFVILPGGDLPHEENPDQFLTAAVPFLEGTDGAT
jgi:pimeloyl-ACP methyl ester carboxylesterase